MTTAIRKKSLNPSEDMILFRIKAMAIETPLVSLTMLRQKAGLTREAFDNAILALTHFGILNLYRSDLPKRLMTAYEADGVIWCGRIAYNACSVREVVR